MNDVIQVAGLTEIYATDKGRPPLVAVAGIDFAVREGEGFERRLGLLEQLLWTGRDFS